MTKLVTMTTMEYNMESATMEWNERNPIAKQKIELKQKGGSDA